MAANLINQKSTINFKKIEIENERMINYKDKISKYKTKHLKLSESKMTFVKPQTSRSRKVSKQKSKDREKIKKDILPPITRSTKNISKN